jgi:non-ribosomal peptide synthetase component F
VVDPDNHKSLVPVGVVSELIIKGHILARGYLKDPARTQASFVDDPPWLLRGSYKQPSRHGRLYKTGDLVRYNMDGTLVYLSRKDT